MGNVKPLFEDQKQQKPIQNNALIKGTIVLSLLLVQLLGLVYIIHMIIEVVGKWAN